MTQINIFVVVVIRYRNFMIFNEWTGDLTNIILILGSTTISITNF